MENNQDNNNNYNNYNNSSNPLVFGRWPQTKMGKEALVLMAQIVTVVV